MSDTLANENKLKRKEDTINENERGLSFNRGFFFYKDQSYLVYDRNAKSNLPNLKNDGRMHVYHGNAW